MASGTKILNIYYQIQHTQENITNYDQVSLFQDGSTLGISTNIFYVTNLSQNKKKQDHICRNQEAFCKLSHPDFFLKEHFSALRMSENILKKEYLPKLKTNIVLIYLYHTEHSLIQQTFAENILGI